MEDAVALKSLMAVDVRTDGTVFDASVPRVLFKTQLNSGNQRGPIAGPNSVSDSYAVSSDGQRFVALVPVGRELEEPITVVLNWASIVRK